MGIARLTQDLHPYLESAVLPQRLENGSAIEFHKLVIDGPSMVYHVHNKVAAYKFSTLPSAGLLNLPTYTQLSDVVKRFLHDLEDHGAIISHIFFDGKLPVHKRPVRIDRLEKSRIALEVQKLTDLDLSRNDHVQLGQQQLSEAIWHERTNRQVANVTLPFIVPAVIEQLKSSRWAGVVTIVPGEAEVYCAPAAKQENACVLTNDSDLALFEDLQEEGVIVLLNSLAKKVERVYPEKSKIEARCWRPGQISQQLGAKSLVRFGFEREEDASANFFTIAERARSAANDNDKAFEIFAKQFRTHCTVKDSSIPASRLRSLDPRLAEVASQFRDIYYNDLESEQHNSTGIEIHSTLPILLEDVSRDSSWRYGQDFRRLAYSLIANHFLNDAMSSSQCEIHRRSRPPIVELLRKGQKIALDTVQTGASLDEQIQSLQTYWDILARYHSHDQQHFESHRTTEAFLRINFLLFGLHAVLLQRSENQKRAFSTRIIMQYVGMAATATSKPRRNARDDENSNWNLMHLNANVQSVLYSLRMVKQAADFVDNDTNMQKKKDEALLQTTHLSPQNSQTFRALLAWLSKMPEIQDLFLDPVQTAELFSKVPAEQLRVMLRPLAEQFDLLKALGIEVVEDEAKIDQDVDVADVSRNAAGGTSLDSGGPWVAGRSRKRKKGPPENKSVDSKKAIPSTLSNGANMFELLRQHD
ncbi:hypothetical protein LTR05_007796 [Lithohypha guttulata]|uniref:Asteroid domain-containing protein n=1 Tax=Lithohypha guttulata TaxID=1690604 RepID=A0AAN7SU88_9EURO|nr:hypothetical protein LTR05_007796 [Lithohypha guttulata]